MGRTSDDRARVTHKLNAVSAVASDSRTIQAEHGVKVCENAAAPIVLDLALFLDLAKRAGRSGIQEWLSFYFKSPHVRSGDVAEHDLFIQHLRLKNTLRLLCGEEPLTHLSEPASRSDA